MPTRTSTHERLSIFFFFFMEAQLRTYLLIQSEENQHASGRGKKELVSTTHFILETERECERAHAQSQQQNQMLRVLHEDTPAIFLIHKLFTRFLCACIKNFHSPVWGFSKIMPTLFITSWFSAKLIVRVHLQRSSAEMKTVCSNYNKNHLGNWCNREGKISKCLPPFI